MLCKAYGTRARQQLLSREHGEKMDNTERSGCSKMHRSDKNIDEVQNTVNSGMVIRSTRLNYAEILTRLCEAVS
jgi:hypothetical protein